MLPIPPIIPPFKQSGTYIYPRNINSFLGIGTTTPIFKIIAIQNGVTPVASSAIVSDAQKQSTIAVQGAGQAYFLGKDVTNYIEFIMGTSVAETVFAGSMTAHDLQLRTNNSTRITIKKNTGYVGIGIADPIAVLHLKAGTATASTAPLKFTAGTNLTVPENGATEFDGSRLYLTVSSTRKTIAYTDDISSGFEKSLLLMGA